MGWNSWNKYHCNINENIIRSMADTFVNSGLQAAGYYVNIDDCWQIEAGNFQFTNSLAPGFPSRFYRLQLP